MRAVHWMALLVVLSGPAYSAETNCKATVKEKYPKLWLDETDKCFCGSQLANLTVTLPKGLKVEAVCGLRLRTYGVLGALQETVHEIDLTREKWTLDSYKDGNLPDGHVFMSGTTEAPVRGTVSTEVGPAGALWFHSNPDRRGPVFWEFYVKSLDLGTVDDYRKLRVPQSAIDNEDCLVAEASIRIRNPVVLIGDTDEAGSGADFDVVSISKYEQCKPTQDDPVTVLSKGQPQDVTALIRRISGCNYYRGDFPYAEQSEKQQISQSIAQLDCANVSAEEFRIKTKYMGNAEVIRAIDGAKALER